MRPTLLVASQCRSGTMHRHYLMRSELLGRREQRLQPRRNTMILATITFDNGRTRLDCVIRNLSEGGAKLELATVRGIPQTFDLVVPGHHVQHCRVAWRALKEMGVQFMPAAA
jgi:hypothetical protein